MRRYNERLITVATNQLTLATWSEMIRFRLHIRVFDQLFNLVYFGLRNFAHVSPCSWPPTDVRFLSFSLKKNGKKE